jgi:hypothetical protein
MTIEQRNGLTKSDHSTIKQTPNWPNLRSSHVEIKSLAISSSPNPTNSNTSNTNTIKNPYDQPTYINKQANNAEHRITLADQAQVQPQRNTASSFMT